jgi:hypothetical protein
MLSVADRGSPPTNTSVPLAVRGSAHIHTAHKNHDQWHKNISPSIHQKKTKRHPSINTHLARRSRPAAAPSLPLKKKTEQGARGGWGYLAKIRTKSDAAATGRIGGASPVSNPA